MFKRWGKEIEKKGKEGKGKDESVNFALDLK